MAEQTRNVILFLLCLVITMASWVFVISYNTGHILDADEWMWWLFWQYIFLFMLLWCFLWCLKKFKIQKDQNEVFLIFYSINILFRHCARCIKKPTNLPYKIDEEERSHESPEESKPRKPTQRRSSISALRRDSCRVS